MLYECLVKFFESGWFALQNDEETYLRLLYDGENGGNWVGYAQAYEDESLFIFYSVFPTSIEESKRRLMSELLTRINYGLKIGNFEMDFDDGEVRYKTSVMLENNDWSDDVIRPVVYYNLSMMDRYWKAFNDLLSGKSNPQEAFDSVLDD